MLAAPTTRSISDFYGDADARVLDFFEAWATDLPSEQALLIAKLGSMFMKVHMRARFGAFFKLTRGQAREVVLHPDVGGDESLLDSLEALAGFKFEEPGVPESAALVNKVVPAARSKQIQIKSESKNGPTISQDLERTRTLMTAVLPDEAIIQCSRTLNPTVNAIEEPEVQEQLVACLEYAAVTWGKINLGAPLSRLWGRQLMLKKKLPSYGQTQACNREWWKILYEGARNRGLVRELSPTALALALTAAVRPFRRKCTSASSA